MIMMILQCLMMVIMVRGREGGCNLHSLGAELGEGRGHRFEAAEENFEEQGVSCDFAFCLNILWHVVGFLDAKFIQF